MGRKWRDNGVLRPVSIDRFSPAVKIDDCLKAGVNTAGNPEQ
jgi:hypothetical protein